ncbi:flagellar hook protein FlgE [Pseudoduganella chitinolytica]|uniref:Flagellar hook protein FlgE n=1 Tax=Pseudoduganella chitinolytica TaxID=34070 RepID=A0ABY8BAD8_9BURK|nr:flagellar hook-basal body complex protein [Pseudoduganella chitinolytica]WEF32855.1 flagellar hook-basal body complex protein [Pseudoduganella chitinolytica]
MFDTIQIGTSGLTTHSKGLKVVGNNLANVNTPGFKSSQLQFGALFEQGGGGQYAPREQANHGGGVQSLGTKLSFRTGVDQGTGNPLDLAINGNGLYTVKRDDKLLYTRTGDFRFDKDNILVNGVGDKVQGLGKDGKLADVTLADLSRSVPHATETIKLSGNLTSTIAVPPVDAALKGLTIYDKAGLPHTVDLAFKDMADGTFTVTVTEPAATAGTGGSTTATVLGTGTVKFAGGFPVAGSDSFKFTYKAKNVTAFDVKLDFSQNVTSLQTATTLALGSQDGYAAGVLVDQAISSDGTVTVRYSNNQTAKGARLALAEFRTEDDLKELAGGVFEKAGNAEVRYGYAGAESFGTLAPGHREGSNVDLAEEFGNLILMQRGYQASSHVISTANDMIQQLFDMKGR